MTVRAPAKINLHLSVGAPRPDGYHDLATVFHAVSLYDELVAAAADELSVSVTTADGVPVDDVPQDGSNLAVAAALALAERTGVEPLVRLHLTKSIPVAGGMAGGSADAAAALVACDALWQTGLAAASCSSWPRGSAATCRSRCSAAPRWAPAAARCSPRCWRAAGSTGWSPSPTAACPRPRCTPSATGCGPAGWCPSRGWPTT